MSRTLIDAQESIERFIIEAKGCATQRLGFAAMLTIFPVILSVSEALYKHKNTYSLSDPDDQDLFKDFVPRMVDKTWLVPSAVSTLSDQQVATELSQVRNGLAHQMSLPNYIGLINTKPEVREFLREHPAVKHVICVVEFVEAASRTVEEIIKNYPNIIFDPSPKGIPRAPAKRVELPSGTSGSTAGR